MIKQFNPFQHAVKLFIHTFDAYSASILAGEYPRSTDYMATVVCPREGRGYDAAKRMWRIVDHDRLWVSHQLTQCVKLDGPAKMPADYFDIDFSIQERISDYCHAPITLEASVPPHDDLLETFNDASFR